MTEKDIEDLIGRNSEAYLNSGGSIFQANVEALREQQKRIAAADELAEIMRVISVADIDDMTKRLAARAFADFNTEIKK